MTDSAFWMRVQALFDEALDWPLADRERRLQERAGDDAALLARVGDLLAAHAATNPLDAPVAVREQAAPEPPPLPAGTRLGVWELQQRLGRGGMGEVYAARRVDGVVAQQAALKVLKRGLDTDAVLARFLRERNILARLSHPNIARLLDAGATPDGRPWLAMERIDGQPLDVWVREQQLAVPDVLALMQTVCEAVQDAHRNLIVHRDLKPANVLVTADGQVKLLDFGIAKLLDEDTPDATRLSGAALPMTPAYAAPEQWRGDNITTATDIYALGVMLYSLLTGRLPRDPGSQSATATTPVTRPSEALRLRPNPERTTGWSRDLDLIVLKALHDEPGRRYASAQALANDLGRYRAREPVSAAPDSWGYRARLFVRRRRALSAGIAATALSLLLGMAGVLWQAHRAQRAADRADRLVEYLSETLSAANPQNHGGQWPTVLDLLATASKNVDQRFADDDIAQARLYATFNGIYNRLNQPERVAQLAPLALKANIAAYGPESRPVALAYRELGETRFGLGDYPGCIEAMLEAARLYRQLDGPDSADAVSSLTLLQASYARLGMLKKAEQASQELIEIARRNPKEGAWGIGQLENNLSAAYAQGGRLREALAMVEQAQAKAVDLPVSERASELVIEVNILRHRIRLWQAPPDAAERAAALVAESESLLGADNHLSRVFRALAPLLDGERGRYAAAAEAQTALADTWQKSSGAEHPQTLRARIEALRLSTLAGRPETELRQQFREASDHFEWLKRDGSLDSARAQLDLLRIAATLVPTQAEAEYQRLETLLQRLPAEEPVVQILRAQAQSVLAQIHGQPREAAAAQEPVLKFLESTREGATRLHAGLMLNQAYLLTLAGDPRAGDTLSAARQLLPTGLPPEHALRTVLRHVEALQSQPPTTDTGSARQPISAAYGGSRLPLQGALLASLWFY